MKTIELAVEKRESKGKNEARRTRMGGRIPAIVYGAGKATVPTATSPGALEVRQGQMDSISKELNIVLGADSDALVIPSIVGSYGMQTRRNMSL